MSMGKGLDPVEAERVRALARLLLERCDGNDTELARRIGLAQPSVSRFVNGDQGTTWTTAKKYAKLAGVKGEDLVAGRVDLEALRRGKIHLLPQVEREDKPDPFEIAAEAALQLDVPKQVVDSLRAERKGLGLETDQRSLWWMRKILARLDEQSKPKARAVGQSPSPSDEPPTTARSPKVRGRR